MIKSEDDAASIEDIAHFSYNQLKDCLVFLEALYSRDATSITINKNHHLALIGTFALEDRLEEIIAEFDGFGFLEDEHCDGGVSNMIVTYSRRRVKNVVATILLKFCGDALSSSTILSIPLLKQAVSKRIGGDILDTSRPEYAANERLLELYQRTRRRN